MCVLCVRLALAAEVRAPWLGATMLLRRAGARLAGKEVAECDSRSARSFGFARWVAGVRLINSVSPRVALFAPGRGRQFVLLPEKPGVDPRSVARSDPLERACRCKFVSGSARIDGVSASARLRSFIHLFVSFTCS